MNSKVTVLMSVHNGEKYLREAIESILNQTFRDFELLIVNDGSTDSSKEIILSYDDSRIVYVENETNIGLTKSLNKGLKLAKGEYIARMDADDISLPERLEKQVEFMDKNKDVGVCGSWIRLIGSKIEWKMPGESDFIKASMIFHNSLFHPTVITRKKVLNNNGLNYNEEFRCAQDYELWSRMKNFTIMNNIQKSLVFYRSHGNQVTNVSNGDQKNSAKKVRKNLLNELGVVFSQEEMDLHNQISQNEIERSKYFLKKVEEWLIKLKVANDKNEIFDKKGFNKILLDKWLLTCKYCANLGSWSWKEFNNSPLHSGDMLSKKDKMILFIKCLIKYDHRR